MKDIAIKYYNLGLAPTSISYIKTKYNQKENNPEKSPAHSWKSWQIRRPALEEIEKINWDLSSGIGAVLGHSSRCIDIDYCDDIEVIKIFLRILRLPENYEWVVKSPNGYHIHVSCDPIYFATAKELINGVLPVLPNSKFASKLNKIELRWANHIVLPPTNYFNKKYKFINTEFPDNSPQYVEIFRVFSALSFFCGTSGSNFGFFEAQNMIFQTAAPSEGYPYMEAILGDNKNEALKNAKLSTGFYSYEDVPKSHKVGYIEFGFGSGNSLHLKSYPKILFLDTETTGLIKNPLDYTNYPRLIQISVANANKIIQTFYIKPEGFVVPSEIETLTGLSNEFLQKNGITIIKAIKSLDIPHRSIIVGHNIDFDLSILDSEYLRVSKKSGVFINYDFRKEIYPFCIMKKFTSIYGGKFPKLTEIYEHFFDESPNIKLHNTENDIGILMDCFNIMSLYGYINYDYENELIY